MTDATTMKNYPRLDRMASGNVQIVLQDGVDYDNFPGIARRWGRKLGLHVVRKVDGPGERVWDCRAGDGKFWLAHDDWFPEISLEPQDDHAGAMVSRIFDRLMADKEAEPSVGMCPPEPPKKRVAAATPYQPDGNEIIITRRGKPVGTLKMKP